MGLEQRNYCKGTYGAFLVWHFVIGTLNFISSISNYEVPEQ